MTMQELRELIEQHPDFTTTEYQNDMMDLYNKNVPFHYEPSETKFLGTLYTDYPDEIDFQIIKFARNLLYEILEQEGIKDAEECHKHTIWNYVNE